MAFRYPVQSANINNGHYESNPSCVIMFIRFAYPASFDRTKNPSGNFVSYSVDGLDANPTAERTPLIVQNDCISWETSSSKESHVSGANFVFVNSGIDYSTELTTGDYVLLWAHNNTADSRRIVQILQGNSGVGQANKFNDGLKFIGRISSIARKASKSPETGVRSVYYSVEAQGFTD